MPVPDLELHPEALEDALAGYAWYLERSARVADGFLKYPHSVVYGSRKASIVIYAFAHCKRRPGYWKDRLK